MGTMEFIIGVHWVNKRLVLGTEMLPCYCRAREGQKRRGWTVSQATLPSHHQM